MRTLVLVGAGLAVVGVLFAIQLAASWSPSDSFERVEGSTATGDEVPTPRLEPSATQRQVPVPAATSTARTRPPAPSTRWTVRGRVLDGLSGKPVAGAAMWTEGMERTRTAEDGTYTFVAEQTRENIVVWAMAPGYVASYREAMLIGELPPLDFGLWAAATISGRILDQEGNGVAGATLMFSSKERLDLKPPATTSDAEGRFELREVTAEPWDVVVVPPKPRHDWRRAGEHPKVNGGDRDVVLRLHRVSRSIAMVTVKAIDARTRWALGIQGASVHHLVRQTSDGIAAAALPKATVEDGIAHVGPLPPGRWRVWVQASGQLWGWTDFAVRPAETEVAVEVLVQPAGAVHGRLDGVTFKLAPPPYVYAESMEEPRPRGIVGARGRAQADAHGEFTIEGLLPGRHRIFAPAIGWFRTAEVDVRPGETIEAVLTLERGAVLRFRSVPTPVACIVELLLAEGDGTVQLAAREGVAPGTSFERDVTVHAGRVRWIVRFAGTETGDTPGSGREVAPTVEGVLQVAAGDNPTLDVRIDAK